MPDGPDAPCPAQGEGATHDPSEPIPFKHDELAVVFAAVCTECGQLLGADGTWF